MAPTMSSAAKTLDLLTYFSAARPEIGLTQLCRLAGRDKATTYRHLQTLQETGFVEQNPATRHYRLGPALLHLAQLREKTVPRKYAAEMAVAELAEATGETAHVSVLSGDTVYPLTSCESPQHGTRAVIDIQTLPLHATASGLCALAFGPEQLVDVALTNMTAFTETTPTTPEALSHAVRLTRQTGFAQSQRSFEAEIHSIGAPVFDHTGHYAGSVNVACVASRLTPELEYIITQHLVTASRKITLNWGGTLPATVTASWAASHSRLSASEAVS